MFESFVDHYCPSVFSVVARLTALPNDAALEDITAEVLVDLWEKRQELLSVQRPGVFIYRVIVRHVFSYFSRQGDLDRIKQLQGLVLIDPAHYTDA